MKKLLLVPALAVLLSACNNTTPKETAQQFIKALSSADMVTATLLASNDTRAVIKGANTEAKTSASPEELFLLSELTETESGSKAVVKNSILALTLVKESEGWRVMLNETLLKTIQNREVLLAEVRAAWEALEKEYAARRKIVDEYIGYKKTTGGLSAKMQALSNAVSKLPSLKDSSGTTRLVYVQSQHHLNSAIDDALEPTTAANSDLTLNYFLQISNAGDRIKVAEDFYQSKAMEARSSRYPPLPFATSNAPKTAGR